jgi:hypothetical protein
MMLKPAAFLCLCAVAPVWAAGLSPQEIVRRMCERDSRNLPVRQQYTYTQTTVVKKLDKKGKVKETEATAEEVLWIDGTKYERLIAKDGKPLSPAQERNEQEKFEREVAKRKSEGDAQRRKRIAKQENDLQQQREYRRQLPEAFDFELLGQETVGGRSAYRIQAEPKPGARLTGRAKSMFPKMRGTLWIDTQTFELAKVEAETIDNVSFGLGTVRLNKGMRLLVEQALVNGEVWFPTQVKVAASAKALLFYGVNVDIDQKLSDFRKYSVESTVTLAEER